MSSIEPVVQRQRGGVLELTLNQPPLNPIGVAQVDKLFELLPVIEQDKGRLNRLARSHSFT